MKKMQSRFGVVALAVLAAATFSSCGPQSRTVVTVADRAVTVADFEDAARNQSPYPGLDPSPEGKQRLLDELIDRELLVAEALRLGLGKGEEMQSARADALEEVLPEMLYRRVVSGRISVSESEVRAVWERQDVQTAVAQIFCLDESAARAAEARLAAGEPFAQVARQMSRDRANAATGGMLGTVIAGQMPAEIERAVEKTAVGRWTPPIPTPVGYYIMKVEERQPRERDPYDQVRGGIESLLRQRKERALVLAYMKDVRERYQLELRPSGLSLLAANWQNRPTDELLAAGGDVHKLGFTDEDLAAPLAVYRGGSYTVGDFFDDYLGRGGLDRPPANEDGTLRLYIEDRATFRLLMQEARERGLEEDPATRRRLRDREEAYLITRLYEKEIVPAAQLSDEERESVWAEAAGRPLTPELRAELADREARLFEQRRQQVLHELLDRLRKAHPPQVNEKALADVPWPVPPKENA